VYYNANITFIIIVKKTHNPGLQRRSWAFAGSWSSNTNQKEPELSYKI